MAAPPSPWMRSALGALLALAGGCAPLEHTRTVERRILDVRRTEDQGQETPRLKATVEVEPGEDRRPVALRGRVLQADVCRTVEHRRVEEVEAVEHRPLWSPFPRALAGAMAGAGTVALGVGAGVSPAGPRRDGLAAAAIVSGVAAAGLIGSVLSDVVRAGETRWPARVRTEDVVVERRSCEVRPGAGLSLRFVLLLRWFKRFESCTLREAITDGEGGFRVELDTLRAAAQTPECRQTVSGNAPSERRLEVSLAGHDMDLPKAALAAALETIGR